MRKLKFWLLIWLRGIFRSTQKINETYTIPEALRKQITVVKEVGDFQFDNNLLSQLNKFEVPVVENSNLDAEGKDRFKPSNEVDYQRAFPEKYYTPWYEETDPIETAEDEYCDIDDLKDQVKPEQQIDTTANYNS